MAGSDEHARRGMRGRGLRTLLGLVCLALGSTLTGTAAAEQGQLAIGFSNLVARLEGEDEIGFAHPEYRVHILEELRAAGFNAVGAESLVFSRDDAEKADLVLGGTVKELECQVVSGSTNCRVGVAWEVLDREADKIVYRVLTRHVSVGVSRENHAATGKRLVLGALRSLTSRPHFVEMTKQKRAALPDGDYPVATFRPCEAPTRELPASFDDAAEGTVIMKDARGFGSGFFLGPDGLLLTAAHVVDRPTIEVRRRNGEQLTGKVVRVSRRFDVALVSVAPAAGGAAFPCLGLNTAPKQPGTDVYAIGAPASQDLAFSLTRGIISGIRALHDIHLIQTDASVSPGNSGGPLVDRNARVVGVVSRKLAGQAVEGVGFGVPIEDALAALKLESGASTSSSLTGGAAVTPTAAAVSVFVDRDDAVPSLDPEGERARRAAAEATRLERERDAQRPPHVRSLRIAGAVTAGLGAVLIFFSYQQVSGASEPTRDQYETARLQNDVGWVAGILGGAAFVGSFVLDRSGSSKPVEKRKASLAIGPSRLQLDVRF